MVRNLRVALFIFFFLLFNLTRADVFLLGPGSEAPSSPSLALSPTELWSEPVIINGAPNTLKISLLRINLIESLKMLRRFYPSAKFAFNSESVLFEVIDGNIRSRIYLVECGKPPYPVLQFSMDMGEIPKHPKWPASLPSAPDITPIQTMEFPTRNAFYGRFESRFSSKTILSSLNSILLADGWQALTREAAQSHLGQSKGEFYIKFNPTEIITVSTLDKDNGTSETIVYRKKIKE